MSGELSVFAQRAVSTPTLQETQDEEDEDWAISLAFSSERHTEKIEGLEDIAQTWRLKDRVIIYYYASLLCIICQIGQLQHLSLIDHRKCLTNLLTFNN